MRQGISFLYPTRRIRIAMILTFISKERSERPHSGVKRLWNGN